MKTIFQAWIWLFAIAILIPSTRIDAQQEQEPATKQKVSGKKQIEDEKKVDESDDEKQAKAAFKKISKVIKSGDWEEFRAMSTPEGADGFCVMVAESLAMVASIDEMPDGATMPGMEDFIETIDGFVKKYELEELVDLFTDIEQEIDDKELLKILDKDGKRWEIVEALWKAQNGSMFAMNPFDGKVTGSNVNGENMTLVIEPSVSEPNAADGWGAEGIEGEMSVVMVVPPMAMTMTKVNGQWLYHGFDEEKSMELMEAFMEEHEEMMESGGWEMDDDGREDF